MRRDQVPLGRATLIFILFVKIGVDSRFPLLSDFSDLE